MGNIQLSGVQNSPHYGYSCLDRIHADAPLRFSSGAGADFRNFGSRIRSSAAACDVSMGSMCCQSGGRQMETFKNREEALRKARYYRERNFELAIHAYNAALDFAPPVFRRSPPPHADDEQMLYVQLLDPSDFCDNRTEESEGLVGSTGRQNNGSNNNASFAGEAKAKGAEACEDKWLKRACDVLGTEAAPVNGRGGSKSSSNAHLQDSRDTSSSTAFSSSGCISRMQSKEFREAQETDVNGLMAEAASDDAEAGEYGRRGQQAAARKPGGDLTSSNSLRDESKALAAHHALTAEICDEVAQLYLAAGHKEEALRYYDRAVRLAPHSVDFLYRRGVVLQLMGEEDAAIDTFRKALELDPACKAALFNLGTCRMRSDSGRKEALRLFHQLAELDPANDQVLSLVAHCYELDGHLEEALTYRQRVVQLDPLNFRANRELNELKEHLLAVGARRRAVETGPGESELVALAGQQRVLGKVA